MSEHIIQAFDQELDVLKQKVNEIGLGCKSQLKNCIQALHNQDLELAEKTIHIDSKINSLQREADALSVEILARRHPVAKDLRYVVASFRIATDLERIADYIAAIAKMIIDLEHIWPDEFIHLIAEMAEDAMDMLESAMLSYKTMDTDLAVSVWHSDDQIDKTYKRLLKRLGKCMHKEKKMVRPCTALLFGARGCERIGDHITNVVENVYFIVHGVSYHGKSGKSAGNGEKEGAS